MRDYPSSHFLLNVHGLIVVLIVLFACDAARDYRKAVEKKVYCPVSKSFFIALLLGLITFLRGGKAEALFDSTLKATAALTKKKKKKKVWLQVLSDVTAGNKMTIHEVVAVCFVVRDACVGRCEGRVTCCARRASRSSEDSF